MRLLPPLLDLYEVEEIKKKKGDNTKMQALVLRDGSFFILLAEFPFRIF